MTRRFAMGVRLHVLAASLGPVGAWLSVIAYVAPYHLLHDRPSVVPGQVSRRLRMT